VTDRVFHEWDERRHVFASDAVLALPGGLMVSVTDLCEIIEAARACASCWDPVNRIVMLRSRVKDGEVDRGDAFDRLQIALQKVQARDE